MSKNIDTQTKQSSCCCGGTAKAETKSAEQSHCNMRKDKPAAQEQKPTQPQAAGEQKAI